MTVALTSPEPTRMGGANRRRLITLRDVTVTYPDGERPVVSGVNLEVNEGECILFLGPSGCGKSTLALAMAGLIPSGVEGDVSGQVQRDPALSRPGGIGYVFQDPDTQFCMLQVDDEIAFGLENASLARETMQGRIVRALRTVGLHVKPNTRHASFSGGMKQKLAIATALALEAPLLVLDEPTANLDPLSTRLVFDTVGLLRSQGRTMVIIEHKFDLVLEHVDRVVLFDADGTIHRIGPTRDLLRTEWDWMIQVGVIPPWKAMPDWLVEDGSSPRVKPGIARIESHQPERQMEPVSPSPEHRQQSNLVATVEFHHASLNYGDYSVWRDVTCSIPAGSLTAVVGPNGAGKSSLLQVIAGLTRLTRGEVTVLNQSVRGWQRDTAARSVSYCFQNPEFQFIYERVGDELANRIVGDDVPLDVQELLTEFGLSKQAAQSPYALSQGQKRRLSVASMLREPHDIYVLDEPTFGQDARTQQVIMDGLHALHRAGKSVVISTHDMDLVRTYATHVLVIANGRLQYAGIPEALFEQGDILRIAHLLDDVEPGHVLIGKGLVREQKQSIPGDEHMPSPPTATELSETETQEEPPEPKRTFAGRLNPGLHLLTAVMATFIAMFANTLPQAAGMFLLPVALLVVVGRLGPVTLANRYAPFLVFYVLYTWSFVAYSAVPKGAPVIHVLWWRLSLIGLDNGLVLALRMLGAVGFGILLVSTSDITEMIVSLTQNFRIRPKFAYGVLAGIRFMPLFQSEWRKLRQARWLRGKDAGWRVLRPVTYALPLLSQAVRMSERVAVAMEARGFVGAAANHVTGRTFYRSVPVKPVDIVYGVGVLAVLIGILVLA